jgi:undecaprenyl-diphosphatase
VPASEPSTRETGLLGLLQGPAELLPISSSAHVGLLPWLLRWRHAALDAATRKEVEVVLHAGTAIALAALAPPRAPLGRLALATAPPALAGLILEGPIQRRLGTPRTVAFGLLAGAAAMAAADRTPERRGADDARAADALWLGAAQALALIPGVSRSGATRAAARRRGFDRPAAAALSREAALPILAGATALKAVRVARRRPSAATLRALGVGTAAAAASTAAALAVERRLAARAPLAGWAAYRAGLAAAILAVDARRRRAAPPATARRAAAS